MKKKFLLHRSNLQKYSYVMVMIAVKQSKHCNYGNSCRAAAATDKPRLSFINAFQLSVNESDYSLILDHSKILTINSPLPNLINTMNHYKIQE